MVNINIVFGTFKPTICFSVKRSDKSSKETVKQQLINDAREAIDKTSFHALPLVTADVASWFKV